MNQGCAPMDQTDMAILHKRVVERFTVAHPTFCGAKVLYAHYRGSSIADIEKALILQKKLMQKLPAFVIGFDLVGQEDLGKPLIDLADKLLAHKLPYYFHAGETNWQGQSSSERNIMDALLLGTKRIGQT